MHRDRSVSLSLLTSFLLLIVFAPVIATPDTPTSQPKTLANSIGMEFVRIPAGTFQMGAADGASDERPMRQVTISQPFYLGKYEVTQGQWQAVMGNNPSLFQGDLEHAAELSRDARRRGNRIRRLSESFARVLSPLL